MDAPEHKPPEDAPGGLTAYQLTVASLVAPLPMHLAFDGLAALCVLLLGHPVLAAVFVAASWSVDALYQFIIRRWVKTAANTDERAGLRRLGALSAFRIGVYLAPTFAMALGGGVGELVYFAVQCCALTATAMSAGALSRTLFFSFGAPPLVAMAALAALKLPLPPALGVALGLVQLATLFCMIAQRRTNATKAWQDAFNANVAMVAELASARDRALAERVAADEAREAARRANLAKSNFLATMSHEIRTPMNGVLGMAQLLKRDERDPAQVERLATLIESGEYLLSILNDILDVSKIDAGHLKIVRGVEDLRLFLDRLVGFWHARAQEKGVALTLTVADEVPDFVWMDALRLRQVLFNLVGNALKFTAKGSVEIVAEARQDGEGAALVRIAVRDTGPGIAPHYLPRLFERFSQADESEARAGGTGLGLAIAKQLTELMDGRIWVESEPDVGSTFHVELPLELAKAFGTGKPAPEAAPSAEALDQPAGLKVLAVDDNAVNLMVLDQLLTSLGHEVVKAAGGAEALDQLAAQAFDLVLMDIQMPGMTGDKVLQRLRAAPGPNQLTPVIALTADVTSGGRERYLAMGFTEHGSKPFRIQELLEAIAAAMSAAPPSAAETARSA